MLRTENPYGADVFNTQARVNIAFVPVEMPAAVYNRGFIVTGRGLYSPRNIRVPLQAFQNIQAFHQHIRETIVNRLSFQGARIGDCNNRKLLQLSRSLNSQIPALPDVLCKAFKPRFAILMHLQIGFNLIRKQPVEVLLNELKKSSEIGFDFGSAFRILIIISDDHQ